MLAFWLMFSPHPLPLSSPDISDNRATAGWRGEFRREGAKTTPRFFASLRMTGREEGKKVLPMEG
jgi:hypothetical protein